MREFKGKVAVITGAGRGIGRAIAERCAEEGMKVVLAGIGMESLMRTQHDLEAQGAETLVVQTDVARYEDVEALAQKTLAAFGAVHVLVNNAGVAGGTNIWESTLADWQWILDVNLRGVIHGVKVFTPIMLAQDSAAHIVNVSSIAGLIAGPHNGIYKVSKHAVVALSETLYYELAGRDAKVKVSVFCPGFVQSDISSSERNRPAELQNADANQSPSPEMEAVREYYREGVLNGIPAAEAADHVWRGIRDEQLYILSHPELNERITSRVENIVNVRNPHIERE